VFGDSRIAFDDLTSAPRTSTFEVHLILCPSNLKGWLSSKEFARRRGKSTAEALDDALADYLEWERQDYQEAVGAVVKATRT
jgi:hypothetical protein